MGLCSTLVGFAQCKSWKERHCLPVQPGETYDGAKAPAARKVESHDLILGDAVENPVRTKAQAARPVELGRSVRREDTNEIPVGGAVLANAGYRIRRTERLLTRHNDVAIGRYDEVERAELRI